MNERVGMYKKAVAFEPPEWARSLKIIPKKRLQLAMSPTPIHPWHLPGQPDGFTISIKRDDMTGSTLSGNKVRKLEFLMADALDLGCEAVITCGGIQSNHGRATAVAARELGLDSYLVLRSTPDQRAKPEELTCAGNQLIDRMTASGVVIVPYEDYETGLKPCMEILVEQIKKERNISTYFIPVGGSSAVGMWGYICAFQELLQQNAAAEFDDIIFACGSGGTASGLAIANYLCGSPMKIHAVSVAGDAAYFHNHLDETIQEVGLSDVGVRSVDILDVIDGYKGHGYAISTEEEHDFYLSVSYQSGILLDPTYTGKAAIGLATEMKKNPSRFKGSRILFLHTGGVFGLYDMRLDKDIRSRSVGQVVSWDDITQTPTLPTIPK